MNYMQQMGTRLVSNGYSVLPIQPGTKKPGECIDGVWRDMSNWSKLCDRQTAPFELQGWARWPGAGVGVACGTVIGVDIDVLDGKVAHAIEALCRETLGDTPAVRVGKAPKRLLVYRAKTPFGGFKYHPIEVLGRGNQFVAYAIHPDTGKPYNWPMEDLSGLDVSELPEVTESQCRDFCEAAFKLLPNDQKQSRFTDGGSHDAQSNPSLRGTVAAVTDALEAIPNHELNYHDWIRIGHAIRGALGPAGEELWHHWSAKAVKNDPDETDRAWRSFHNVKKIGAGTLYELALKHGWVPKPGLTLNAAFEGLTLENSPAAAMISQLRDAALGIGGFRPEPPPAEPDPAMVDEDGEPVQAQWGEVKWGDGTFKPKAAPQVPPDLYKVGGVLQQIMEFTLATAIRPQPFLALGAAVALVATLMGRKYRTSTNLRSNVYIVGMAPSGGGKDHARKVINVLLDKAQMGYYLGGSKIASGTGLLSALQRQPSALFQMDEFGQWMSLAVDKKRAPKHIAEIWDYLTELYTSASSVFLGTEYADQKANKRVDIVQPCCVLHATTVPEPFWNALQSGATSDGSLARWLIFESDNGIPDQQRRPDPIDRPPPALIEALKSVEQGVPGHAGKLGTASAKEAVPIPYIVTAELPAQAALDGMDDDLTIRMRQAERRGTGETSVLARIGEQVRKLALIRAVSNNPGEPMITTADVAWARSLVEHCTSRMLQASGDFIADNETEREVKRVLGVVTDAGPAGITKTELMRRTRYLKPRRRDEIILDLCESGEIETGAVLNGTRPMHVYRRCS